MNGIRMLSASRTCCAPSRKQQQPVIITLFVIICLINNSQRVSALQCYKCTMTKPSPHTNETTRLCSNFDYSERYIVDCPFSTLCMKKDFSVNLTTPINGTERDCAQQRYEYQDFENGKWRLKVAIKEPYTEGCSTIDDKGLRSSRTEFCYCRGELCNASNILSPSILTIALLYFLYEYTI